MDFSQNIWVEKYRPKTVEDLCLPDECEENLQIDSYQDKVFIADRRIINQIISNPGGLQDLLFFSEEYGTGKTSTLRLIGKLIGAKTKLINASLDVDAGTIEKEILSFARFNSFKSELSPKLIILDELEGAKAKTFQEPLKAALEYISNTTRICASCNDKDAITGALQSRMVKVNFSHSNPKYIKEIKIKMKNRLVQIAKNEDIEYDENLFKQLIDNNYPDFRTVLDNAQMIYGLSGKLLASEQKNDTFGYQTVTDALVKGDYLTARSEYLKMQMSNSVFITLLRYFEKLDINPLLKLDIVTSIGHASNFHKEAANKEVNIALMFSNICKSILEYKK
jgi:DNA polymerase III delta prime subunit